MTNKPLLTTWIDRLERAADDDARRELLSIYLAEAWTAGHRHCYDGGGEDGNPYAGGAD